MIAFLVKVRVKTIFSFFDPIRVEPLELCYLKTVLDELNVENHIVDRLFKLKAPLGIVPDVIVLNGYNVAEDEIRRQALFYKKRYPKTVIIVSGVHVQGNAEEFHRKGIDYVFHAQSLNSFRRLIQKIGENTEENFLAYGADTRQFNRKTGEDRWHIGKREPLYEKENIRPDRSFFAEKKNQLYYLEKRRVGLIKGSIGCRYDCSYCYCKEINQGQYVKPEAWMMVDEMETIKADYLWIVDDVLFSDREEALRFMEICKEKNLKKKMIGYLRADFILREKDLLASLRRVGLVEVIVGFEATNNAELRGYGKTTDALDYPQVISLLKENHIDFTALFMVKPDYGVKDFRRLNKFIKDNGIQIFTLSILTPMKGTREYEKLKGELRTKNPEKFDFMHLVMKSKLPRFLFYLLFYGIQLKLLKSRRVWQTVLRK